MSPARAPRPALALVLALTLSLLLLLHTVPVAHAAPAARAVVLPAAPMPELADALDRQTGKGDDEEDAATSPPPAASKPETTKPLWCPGKCGVRASCPAGCARLACPGKVNGKTTHRCENPRCDGKCRTQKSCPAGCNRRWCAAGKDGAPATYRCETPRCTFRTFQDGSGLGSECSCDYDQDARTPENKFSHVMFYAGRGDMAKLQDCLWMAGSRNCTMSAGGMVGKEQLVTRLNQTAQECCAKRGDWYSPDVDQCW